MGRVLRCVVIASIAFASKASAQADVNLRNILVALTNDDAHPLAGRRLGCAPAAERRHRAPRRQLADLGVQP